MTAPAFVAAPGKRSWAPQIEADYFREPELSACERLFRGVIIRALEDMTLPRLGERFDRKNSIVRNEIISWLAQGDDFDLVCDCADLEPTAVKAVFAALLDERSSGYVSQWIKAILINDNARP